MKEDLTIILLDLKTAAMNTSVEGAKQLYSGTPAKTYGGLPTGIYFTSNAAGMTPTKLLAGISVFFFFICEITVSLNNMYFNISSIQHLFISYKLNFNMANGFFCLMNKGTTLGEAMINPLQWFSREDRGPV